MHVAIRINTSYLQDRIKEANSTNKFFQHVKVGLQQQEISPKFENYKLENGILKDKDRFYVPNSKNIRRMVLKEMHNVPYVGLLGCQKTIETSKKEYYWPGMKKEIVKYIDVWNVRKLSLNTKNQ